MPCSSLSIYLFQIRHLEPARQNIRLQRIIVLISVILFLAKVIAWFLTNSVAILTDALESTVNVAAGFFGLYSLHVSARPRDTDHPYGHGKIEFISAAIEGTLIFVAGLFIIYEGVYAFFEPRSIQQLDLGILLIAISAIINFVAGTICIRIGSRNDSLALIASGKHLRSDTYTSAGLVIGLILLFVTGWKWIDSVIAITFALVIIVTGYRIIRKSIAGIMDEADEVLIRKIVAMLQKNRTVNWIDLHNLRVIKYGPTLHIDCHLTVPWYFNVHEAHREVDDLSSLVRRHYGESVELFVHSDGCLEFSCPICDKFECTVRQHAFQKKITWTLENISQNNKHQLTTSQKIQDIQQNAAATKRPRNI